MSRGLSALVMRLAAQIDVSDQRYAAPMSTQLPATLDDLTGYRPAEPVAW